MPGKPQLCWDACAYISLLTGENRTPEEMKKLRAIEQMVSSGRAVVFTSTIALVEVLASKLTPEQATKFKGLLGNPDTPFQPVDTRVAELAHEIRNFYDGKVAVPDAIYLATAIHYEATALHTYDGCSARKRPGDLLHLPQPIAGKYRLTITVPEVPVEPPREPEAPIEHQHLLFENADKAIESIVSDETQKSPVTTVTTEVSPADNDIGEK